MPDQILYDMEFVDPTMTTWTLLCQTWIAANKVDEAKLSKIGLTPEKLAVLWVCRDYPGTLTPSELSRLLFREAQTIAGLLNRMEKEGLVRRTAKRVGHPFTEIKLTSQGEEICGRGLKVHKDLLQRVTSDMPAEERRQLHKTLRALRQKILDEIGVEIQRQPKGFPPDRPLLLNW